jgi:hypothetical protein
VLYTSLEAVLFAFGNTGERESNNQPNQMNQGLSNVSVFVKIILEK